MRCEYAPICQGTIAQGTCDYCGVAPAEESEDNCRVCHNLRANPVFGPCEHCGAPPMPTDYETCGDCGFDHEYEPNEANKAHQDMIKGKVR